MQIKIDLRLLGVSMELSTLETHIELIEEQITRGGEAAERQFRDKRRELNCDDETDWDLLRQERDYQVDFVLPRVLRIPFLVTLFTVYEAAVTEIASLVQEKKGIRISIDDLKGGLLNRAQKYYGSVLEFQLSQGTQHWQRISLLFDLRNSIAHTNGRLDLVKSQRKRKILRNPGVSEYLGCIVVNADFLQESFMLVKEELEGLVDRYKQWDTGNRSSLATSS